MNWKPDNQEILARIVETIGVLKGWRLESAADYLLASDQSGAKDCLRKLAPLRIARSSLSENEFWRQLDYWLDKPPVERCLAHVQCTERTRALALYSPLDPEVEEIVNLFVRHNDTPRTHETALFGLHSLSAIYTLAQATIETARRLLPRIRPSGWIEEQEFAVLCNKLDPSQGATKSRPSWVRAFHPAIGRDPIAGALSRATLTADANDVLSREWIDRTPSDWLIYGDIDNLKTVNDTLGFLAGHTAIHGVVQTLQQQVGDRVLRFGGDEFLIFCEEDGREMAENLRREIAAAQYSFDGETIDLTMSFGVTRGGDMNGSLSAAEDAVNEAKDRGRNCVVVSP